MTLTDRIDAVKALDDELRRAIEKGDLEKAETGLTGLDRLLEINKWDTRLSQKYIEMIAIIREQQEKIEDYEEVLEDYGVEDFYAETTTMGGTRPPACLADEGGQARRVLDKWRSKCL